MKWRNVDKILPDYNAACVVNGLRRIVRHDHYKPYWRLIDCVTIGYHTEYYKEWLYYDEVLELMEEDEE